MSPQRRDAEGRPQTAHSWESLVERQIPEAMEAGAFDGLPHQGERLPLEDDSAAGDWAMAHRMLRNAGVAPPWIEADKEARRLLAELEAAIERAPRASPLSRARERKRVGRILDDANRAIARVNAEAPTPSQHRGANLGLHGAAHPGCRPRWSGQHRSSLQPSMARVMECRRYTLLDFMFAGEIAAPGPTSPAY